MDSPVGAIVTFGLVWAGILLLLALVSYTPNDVPAWVPFVSMDSQYNDPAHNLVGVLGAIVAAFHYFLLGAGGYLVAVGLCWFGLSRFVAKIPLNQRTIGGLAIFILAGASLAHSHAESVFFKDWAETMNIKPGGEVGALIGGALNKLVGGFASQVVLLPAYLVGLVMLTGFHPVTFVRRCLEDWEVLKTKRKERRWEDADELERVAIEEREAKKAVRSSKKRPKKKAAEESEDEGEEEEEGMGLISSIFLFFGGLPLFRLLCSTSLLV